MRLVLPLLVLVVASGCQESGPPTAPVTGVVLYQGEPVQYAKVMFFPQDVPNGLPGFAQTDEEGKFSEVFTGTKKGAVVGTNFVTVTEDWPPGQEIPEGPSGMQLDPPRGPWAQKYRDSSNPELKVEVLSDGENHFEFDVSK